jgi:hypothetical protein
MCAVSQLCDGLMRTAPHTPQSEIDHAAISAMLDAGVADWVR